MAAIGAVALHALTMVGPCPSSAAWGWSISVKDAPEINAKMNSAPWSCAEQTVGLDGTASDEYRKANNLNYGDGKLNEYFMAQCKCSVVPNPGFKCDIAETLLVGRVNAEHKKLKDGDVIQPAALGPDCTNNGYPGAPIDCVLMWQKDPVCTKAGVDQQGCCSTCNLM